MGKQILVIDDDQDILEVLEGGLDYLGFWVKSCTRGDDAFDNIDGGYKPGLVLMNYILSGINGDEICRQIKNKAKKRNIQVIILTAVYLRVFNLLKLMAVTRVLPNH